MRAFPVQSHRRASLVAAGCLSILLAAIPSPAAFAQPSPATAPSPASGPVAEGSPQNPYSPTSFWNTPLPANVPLNPNSAKYAAEIATEVRNNWGGHAAFNEGAWSPTVYTVPPGQPTVTVGYSNCQHKSWIDPSFVKQMSAVPIPPNAVPGGGGDAEMAIYQPSTNTEWDMWRAAKSANGSWSACWGGKLTGVSSSGGVFARPYGATATGLGLMGGLVTPADLASGTIRHAIAMSIIYPAPGVSSWPANRTDGWGGDIPEGLRFRLDPSIDVASLHLTPLATMVARAMQTYGVVIRDKAGSVALYGEDPASSVNPYAPYSAGKPYWGVLDGLPWGSLQALPLDYHDPAGSTGSTGSTGSGYYFVGPNGTSEAPVLPPATLAGVSGSVVAVLPGPGGGSYTVTSRGRVLNEGGAPWEGSPAAQGKTSASVVAAATGPGGKGYYVLTSAGNVFNYGAPWEGSPAAQAGRLGDAVSIATSATGYYVLTSAGNVFNYGAPWEGSPAASGVSGSSIAIASRWHDDGYWVATPARVLSYGQAGGLAGQRSPVNGLAPVG